MPTKDNKLQLMKVVFTASAGGIFIVLAIGMFLYRNFPIFVSIFYWFFIFTLLGLGVYLLISKHHRKTPSSSKIIDAEVIVRK